MKQFVIHKDDYIRRNNTCEFINLLDPKKKWRVTIKQYRKNRSLDQNAYIHAVPLKLLSDHTGFSMDEIKEFMCGEFMGWYDYKIFEKVMSRPIKTTSQMDTSEMSKFIEFMQWYGSSKLNLYIPSPNEWDGEW